MQYDTLLLDNDGVLLEYGYVRRDRFREEARSLLDEHGLAYEEDDVELFTGWVEHDAFMSFCDGRDVDPATLWREREHRFADLKRENMEQGYKELYDDVSTVLSLDDVKKGIVSNNQHRTIQHMVEVFGLDDDVDTYYGKEPGLDGFERKKPAPYYLEKAIEDLDGDRVLYVGDSSFDVEAADRAGVDVAYLEREHNEAKELDREPAYRIGSLEELPAIIEGSREKRA